MKIVHLLGWFFPDSIGGTEVYVDALCGRLQVSGYDVRIAAPIAREDGGPSMYRHGGVPVFRYPIPAAPSRDEAYQRRPVRGADALYRWLAEEHPDVLHIHSFTTGVGLPELREAKRLGMRTVATCHLPGIGYMCRSGELMQWGRVPCDGLVEPAKCGACNLARLGVPRPLADAAGAIPVALGSVLRRLPGQTGTALGMSASVAEYGAMQRELFDLVDAFVVLNEAARQMLIANGSPPAKLSINRLGLSQPHVVRKSGPRMRPTGAPVRFGYMGRLHRTKGLHELACAVRRTPADASFTLDIRGPVGTPADAAYVGELSRLIDGDCRVRLREGVPASEVPRVLADLDVLVCPSMWFENGPTIAIEAQAVGTPVIGSRIGNLAELIVDGVTGRLLPPGDEVAWAAAMTDVAARPADTIDLWRDHLPCARTMTEVVADYVALYAA